MPQKVIIMTFWDMRQLEGALRTGEQGKILSLDTLEGPNHSSFPPGKLAHASKSHNYDFWRHAPGLQGGTGRAHNPDRHNQAPWKNFARPRTAPG